MGSFGTVIGVVSFILELESCYTCMHLPIITWYLEEVEASSGACDVACIVGHILLWRFVLFFMQTHHAVGGREILGLLIVTSSVLMLYPQQ